jgi:ornithine decarboxylase
LFPSRRSANARQFTQRFNGRVLYALKANRLEPSVAAIYAGGVLHFDTSSLPKICTISECYPDSHTYFMHPVKAWKAMEAAYHRYGVRHFVVDHMDELNKVMDVLGDVQEAPIVMVRLATPTKEAAFNLS